MGQDSKIEWTTHTFNPWRGCTRVSPGCEHCYAEVTSKRNPAQLGTWGAGGTRVIASESYWRQPERWNRAAEKAGERHRVFCASLADVFEDRPELVGPRERLFALIANTTSLDWLLLTKRPENVRAVIEDTEFWGRVRAGCSNIRVRALHRDQVWPLPNVWLGVSVEDQRRADERREVFLSTPAAVHFVSAEPLLGPVDLSAWFRQPDDRACDCGVPAWEGAGQHYPFCACFRSRLDWVIVGGESGPKARPMDLAWARSLVEQGRAAGVPVFCKQVGARPRDDERRDEGGAGTFWLNLRNRKGGDPDEWPADLRVREFPAVKR